jgi:prepilin-type N-terminal cleavage/methylation domain-containing protein/prepilin-type processing-associated H-X9-DG protein
MTRRKAFTLIELLVVVAIIALLVAVLLPALGHAKAVARKAMCQSGIRQIGMAILAYSDEYHNCIPRNPDPVWFQVFLPYLGMPTTDYSQAKVYRCPAFPDPRQAVCYVINSWTFDGISDQTGHEVTGVTRMSSFDQPSKAVYLADNEAGPWRPVVPGEEISRHDVWQASHLPNSTVQDDRTNGRRVPADRHLDGVNCWFVDGHSNWVHGKTMTVDMWRDDWD